MRREKGLVLFIGVIWASMLTMSAMGNGVNVVFHEDWKNGQGLWDITQGVWKIDPASGRAGTMLGPNYPVETDSRLVSPIIQLPAVAPCEEIILYFWNWFVYGDGVDTGYVQVYDVDDPDPKKTWGNLSSFTRDSGGWSRAGVYFTKYAGKRIRLGFLHTSDWHYTYQGWYLGAMELVQKIPEFTGDFTNWDDWRAAAVWDNGVSSRPAGGCPSGNCMGTGLTHNYPVETDAQLASPPFRLRKVSPGEDLYLRFDTWFEYTDRVDYGQVNVYVQDEATGDWTGPDALATFTGNSGLWFQKLIRLTGYAGKRIVIGFAHHSDWHYTYSGWYIDNVEVDGIEPCQPPSSPDLTLLVGVVNPSAVAGEEQDGAVPYDIPVVPGQGRVPVTAGLTLGSTLKGPDGVQGWSVSVLTDPSFAIETASTAGTVADTVTNGGYWDDGFNKTEVVDPAKNGGQEGAVSAVVLSFASGSELPPVGDFLILKLGGSLDASSIKGPGEKSLPCRIHVAISPEPGLVGGGQRVETMVSVLGSSVRPGCVGASLRLLGVSGSRFVRGDVDANGTINLPDAIRILSLLFVDPATEIPCMDAADTTDAGSVTITSAVYLLNWLFIGGPAPPPPSPNAPTYSPGSCGPDPTDDSLGCKSFTECS